MALHNGSQLKINVAARSIGQQSTTNDSAGNGSSVRKEYRSPLGTSHIYQLVFINFEFEIQTLITNS